MSEHITHTGVMDDCFRLAISDTSLHPHCEGAMVKHYDLARMACVTRWGDQFTVQLAEEFRDATAGLEEGEEPDESQLRRLAFVLGWIVHRSADRQMKPLLRELAAATGDTSKPKDCSVYHDVHILKKVYGISGDSPFSLASMGVDKPDEKYKEDWRVMREVFRTLFQQTLIETHTLIPDKDDVGGWIDRLDNLRQKYPVEIRRYAIAFSNPDPELEQKYIHDCRFYVDSDAVITLARARQHARHLDPISLADVVKHEAESHYGAALIAGLRYILAVSEFLYGHLDADALHTSLQIGKKGRDGLSV